MATFTDNQNREWEVSMTVGTMKRVKELVDVDLGKILMNEDDLSQLFNDVIKVVDVIWAIVCEQAEKANVTERDFAESLSGDAFENAVIALSYAIVDFCPSRLAMPLQQQMATTLKEEREKQNQKIKAMRKKRSRKASTTSAGNSRASAAAKA